ncbi:MAG: hypothetical protein AAF561_00915 [Planctomycetota bacterium]
MPSKDFVPTTDSKLRDFALNFFNVCATDSVAFNLQEPVLNQLDALTSDFVTKLAKAVDPMTRGTRTVFEKDKAKNALVAAIRKIARQVNGLMDVTDDQRQALGLNIRDTTPTRIDPPTVAPYVRVTDIKSGMIHFELRQDGDLRAKPENVADALVFTHVGETAPVVSKSWNYAMTTGRTNCRMVFPEGAGGKKVWITAFWTNAKGQSGPNAQPVSVDLPHIAAQIEEADEQSPMRIAA